MGRDTERRSNRFCQEHSDRDPALLAWRFGQTEASRIRQPVLAVYGGESITLWARFGETQQLMLKWFPRPGLPHPGRCPWTTAAEPPGHGRIIRRFLVPSPNTPMKRLGDDSYPVSCFDGQMRVIEVKQSVQCDLISPCR